MIFCANKAQVSGYIGKTIRRKAYVKYLIILVLASLSLAQEEDSIHIAGSDSLSLAETIITQAISYLGVPYVYGGIDESGFDCSGLAYRVFNDNGIELPRTVTAIGELGVAVNRDSLQPGDILIFHNPTHTGIYIGDGEFIHCSSYLDRGVVITAITQSNYARRYYSARRILAE